MACHGAIPAHLILVAVLSIGALSRDPFARLLQHTGAAMILVGAVVSLIDTPGLLGEVRPVWLAVYPAVAILAAIVYGRLVRNWLYFGSAAASFACWLVVLSIEGYRQMRQTMAGLDYILWGTLSLIVAMFISLTKTALAHRWLARQREEPPAGDESRIP